MKIFVFISEYYQIVRQSLAAYSEKCAADIGRANQILAKLITTKIGRETIGKIFRYKLVTFAFIFLHKPKLMHVRLSSPSGWPFRLPIWLSGQSVSSGQDNFWPSMVSVQFSEFSVQLSRLSHVLDCLSAGCFLDVQTIYLTI